MKSLYVLVFLSSFISATNDKKGILVVLKGICSAGKSSICHTLAENNPSWKSIDEDKIYIKVCNNTIKKSFPEQYEVIKQAIKKCNRFHAIQRKQIIFKVNTSESQKDATLQSVEQITTLIRSEINDNLNKEKLYLKIKNIILKKINNYLTQGKNVIVDSWMLSPRDVQNIFPNTSIFFVMAYSSLPVVTQRFMQRNKLAFETNNFNNRRLIRSVVESFQSLYTLSNQTKEQVLDILDKQEFLNFVEYVRNCIKLYAPHTGIQPLQYELSEEKLNDWYVQVINLFQNGNVYITIPSHYDFYINTSKNLPKDHAQIIKEKVCK